MSKPRLSARFDRRKATRRKRPQTALIHSRRRKGPKENARIEEFGSGGIRIASGTPLKKEESVLLYVGERKEPMGAKVVWVEKDGLIEKRATGRPGQAYKAGCRLKTRRARSRKLIHVGRGEWQSRLLAWLFFGGAVTAIGLFVYFILSILTLI